MYICICHQITDRQIRRVVEQGASTLCEVQRRLPVGGCCGCCVESAKALISEQRDERPGLLDGRVAVTA
jgi:bacterioferritin-associated ferredoxin